MRFKIAIVTASDKGAAGLRSDESKLVIERMTKSLGEISEYHLLPDDRAELADKLRAICDSRAADVIFTTGGTGLSPRDVTPEATLDVAERLVPGMAEAMRAYSMRITPGLWMRDNVAMLSRAVCAIRASTLIVNLPGSPKAVQECLEAVLPAIRHGLDSLKGNVIDCAR